jgi:hypothetical protein
VKANNSLVLRKAEYVKKLRAQAQLLGICYGGKKEEKIIQFPDFKLENKKMVEKINNTGRINNTHNNVEDMEKSPEWDVFNNDDVKNISNINAIPKKRKVEEEKEDGEII